MTIFASQPQSMQASALQSLQNYWPVLKGIWSAIVFVAVVKAIVSLLAHEFVSVSLNFILWAILAFAILFAFTLALYQANEILNQRAQLIQLNLPVVFKRFLKVVLAAFLIMLLLIVTSYGLKLLVNAVYDPKPSMLTVMIFFFIGFILLAEMLYCLFVIPLVVIDNCKLPRAFIESARFTKEEIWKIMLIYFCVAVMGVIIAPNSHHEIWLQQHYLLLPFDLIALALLMPWILNMIIFTLHDLKLRNIQ